MNKGSNAIPSKSARQLQATGSSAIQFKEYPEGTGSVRGLWQEHTI